MDPTSYYSPPKCPTCSLRNRAHWAPICPTCGKSGQFHLSSSQAHLNLHQNPLRNLEIILLQTGCTALGKDHFHNPRTSGPSWLAQQLHACATKWVQHSRRISRNANDVLLSTRLDRKRPKHPKRDEHRSTRLKLRKLQNMLLLSPW
jgi:hypothetical protein